MVQGWGCQWWPSGKHRIQSLVCDHTVWSSNAVKSLTFSFLCVCMLCACICVCVCVDCHILYKTFIIYWQFMHSDFYNILLLIHIHNFYVIAQMWSWSVHTFILFIAVFTHAHIYTLQLASWRPGRAQVVIPAQIQRLENQGNWCDGINFSPRAEDWCPISDWHIHIFKWK